MTQLHVCQGGSSHHIKELNLRKVGTTYEYCCMCAKAAPATRSEGAQESTPNKVAAACCSLDV